MSTTPRFKRGDADTLEIETGVDLTGAGYTAGQVFLRSSGTPSTSVTKAITAADWSGTVISCDLTSADMAVVGNYLVEVEMTPGPHTYPTDGYAHLEIVADLG